MKKILLLTIVAFTVWACDQKQGKEDTAETTEVEVTEEEAVEEEVEEEELMAESGAKYGMEIDENGAMNMTEFETRMQGKDSLNIKIEGVAKDVCKKKGCWMKVETASGDMMRVTFRDYGFFVPKDIPGREVVMQGTAYKDTTSVEDLRHYAKDGGATDDEIAAIMEPKIETVFIADGVVLR